MTLVLIGKWHAFGLFNPKIRNYFRWITDAYYACEYIYIYICNLYMLTHSFETSRCIFTGPPSSFNQGVAFPWSNQVKHEQGALGARYKLGPNGGQEGEFGRVGFRVGRKKDSPFLLSPFCKCFIYIESNWFWLEQFESGTCFFVNFVF